MGQVQRVAHDRADAAAPGGRGNAERPRVVDEVPDDQEVRRVTELFDDAQLAIQAVQDFLG